MRRLLVIAALTTLALATLLAAPAFAIVEVNPLYPALLEVCP